MRKFLRVFLLICCGLCELYADTTEMIFYPQQDFSSAVSHFYHQGDKFETYGFLFYKGFNKDKILYAQPKGYDLETLKNGKVRLVFNNTDHYSYIQKSERADFIVGEEKGVIKLLVSAGDCVGSDTCLTEENILTVVVPKGYDVINYKGLDSNLQELKTKEWNISSESYILFAPKVKGASIYMELVKTKPLNNVNIVSGRTKNPPLSVYQNKDLFVVGDILLTSSGRLKLKKFTESINRTDKIAMRVFQDKISPKRLAKEYPTAQLFSKGRAESIKQQMIRFGMDERRLTINVIDDKSQAARVEMDVIPVR